MTNGSATRVCISVIAGFNIGLTINGLRSDTPWTPFAITAGLLVVVWVLSLLESERSRREYLDDIRALTWGDDQ